MAQFAGERENRPVPATAERLRDLIYGAAPDARLGSLRGLAAQLGVGIVTLQQAARVLEHQGLLEVRRGPGGGYYGRRPDQAALQRAITAYIRAHPVGYAEALDIMTLLFAELIAAAAVCRQPAFVAALEALAGELDDVHDAATVGAFEARFQELLFQTVDRPLFALLTQVALRLYDDASVPPLFGSAAAIAEWRTSRQRVFAAILAGDGELARFEGERARRDLLTRFAGETP